MKTSKIIVSKFASWTMVLAMVICLIPMIDTTAQRTTTKTKEHYNLYYRVDIKGNGLYKNGPKSVSWLIDRTYDAVVDLVSQAPTVNPLLSKIEGAAALKSGRFKMWGAKNFSRLPSDFGEVTIKDKTVETLKDRGEGRSFENYTTTTTWSGKSEIYGGSPFIFMDSLKGTYNVYIPLTTKPGGDEKQLEITQVQKIERSDFGYGDLPTSEKNVLYDKWVPFETIEIPDIKGVLKGGIIYHDADLPAKFVDGGVTFDSGEVPFKPFIASSSFPGGLQTDATATIHVYYKFAKGK